MWGTVQRRNGARRQALLLRCGAKKIIAGPRFATLCALIAMVLSLPAYATDELIQWEPLSEGLEQTTFRLAGTSFVAPSVVAVRASLGHMQLRVIRAAEFGWKRASAKSLCKASGASVCMNSNFFDEQGKPLGLVMSRGILHQKSHNGGGTLTGVLFVAGMRIGISHRSNFAPDGVLEATQAGPRLLSEGAPVAGLKNPSSPTNLSLACIDRENRVILARIALGVFGNTIQQIQETLLRPEMGCYEAINFDGGGSSQLYISTEIPGHAGAVREENFPGRDEIPVAVGLFRHSR